MPGKSSAIARTMRYFRECELDEGRAAFTVVSTIMAARIKQAEAAANSQTKAASTPRKQRRTKAQMAQAAAAGSGVDASNDGKQESLANA
jgi:hypothetical protein